MNDPDGIDWSELNRLFSVVLCLDESMAIIHASDTPRKYMPVLEARPVLADVFDVRRPNALKTYEEAMSSTELLCLMTAKDGRFAVRGQLVRARYGNKPVICFCGSPWLFWINTHCPDLNMGLADYSMQDVQLDQLFFMNTEKQMVEDLETLTEELQTAKMALEKTQEAQRRFFAQMSHEMRTPLNGVVSALTLLDRDPSQVELISLAKSSSNNLMEVINYVLDVSKLEFTGIEEGEKAFNLSELLHLIRNVIKARAVEKSLDLNLDLEINPAASFYGKPALLQQALLNLLINAIKFTQSGSVTLSCRPVAIRERQHTLRFEVIDTGIGIAEEHQESIFEPFWSGHSDKDRELEKGTGLGLDIVRRNIEHLGGKIRLDSKPGSGSTFWFELCLTAGKHHKPRPPQEPASSPDDSIEGRILLVDDNDTNLLLGSMILESLGVEVATAPGGAESVSAAREGKFDLILMDLTMPDVDGVEATKRIREFADESSLPILALTAHADTMEKKTCLAAGMNAYLTKPIVREELAKALRRWIPDSTKEQTPPHSGASTIPGDTEPEPHKDLLDQSVLMSLEQQIGRKNLALVLTKVLSEAAQRWDELTIADAADDIASMQRHAHSLGSIFRSAGLMQAGDALAAIETSLRAGQKPDRDWLETLEPLKSASLQALQEALPATP